MINITFITSENVQWLKDTAAKTAWSIQSLPVTEEFIGPDENGKYEKQTIVQNSHNFTIDVENKTIIEAAPSLTAEQRINDDWRIFEDSIENNSRSILSILAA